ncbi:hypothetical protein KBA73_02740 [Patescibacteria group bacterium]|nr:hypothetical protein [Patescibacteria group bacterium]
MEPDPVYRPEQHRAAQEIIDDREAMIASLEQRLNLAVKCAIVLLVTVFSAAVYVLFREDQSLPPTVVHERSVWLTCYLDPMVLSPAPVRVVPFHGRSLPSMLGEWHSPLRCRENELSMQEFPRYWCDCEFIDASNTSRRITMDASIELSP